MQNVNKCDGSFQDLIFPETYVSNLTPSRRHKKLNLQKTICRTKHENRLALNLHSKQINLLGFF